MVTKTFTINTNISKSITSSDDTLFIEGIANTGQEDLVGDKITTEALQSIADQAITVNLHYNHNHESKDILGPIVESELQTEGVWIKAKILDEHKSWIQSHLDQGVIYGLSISGCCEYKEGSFTEIVEWTLTEISLTDTPCDNGTRGSVSISKSFDNILNEIIQNNTNNGGKSMSDEQFTKDDVISLINEAFNEKKEEYLETIRDELSKEYDVIINELKERVDALENTSQPNGDTGDGDDDGDPTDNGGDDGDPGKSFTEEQFQKAVEQKVKEALDNISKNVSFKYNPQTPPDDENKNTFTAEELAKMI